MSKFIGYDRFLEISPERFRDNDKRNWIFNIFSPGIYLRDMSCIFLATQTLDVDSRQSISDEKRPNTRLLIDTCTVYLVEL